MPRRSARGFSRAATAVATLVACVSLASAVQAPTPHPAGDKSAALERVKTLNKELRDPARRGRGNGPRPSRQLLEERAQAMRSLIELDPGQAVTQGLTPVERQELVALEPVAESLLER